MSNKNKVTMENISNMNLMEISILCAVIYTIGYIQLSFLWFIAIGSLYWFYTTKKQNDTEYQLELQRHQMGEEEFLKVT